MTEPRDYRATVFLPKTDFPMKAGLPQKEPGILARWEDQGIYQQLRAARAGREKFILHDGPPYANGDMHIGHAMQRILKDMVVRTQTLLGKDAPFVPGWDCHGLPIEWKVEEQYRKKKLNKDEVPVEEFRAECRAYAQHWVNVQRSQLQRLGLLGDWQNPYLTMDFDSEATIVSELMKFAESGQLYRGAKPVMWSPVEKTALAEAEVEYEDIVSTQIDVAFEIVECPNVPELEGAFAVIWTTTPWTIPVNQALAYGAEVEYRIVEWRDKKLLIADSLVTDAWYRFRGSKTISTVSDESGPYLEVVEYKESDPLPLGIKIKGSELAGTIARHPMHHLGGFFAKPRPFLDGSAFVTTESGTGLVHMAPDHGEDDFALCKGNGIEPVFAVEADGKYRADWAWLGGQGPVAPYSPKGLDKLNIPEGPICSQLREVGALLSAAPHTHSYPHSWRSKAKVIYRCTPQWFVPMDREITPPPPAAQAVPLPVYAAQKQGGSAPPHFAEPNGEVAAETADGGVSTLRQTAMAAIAATRFIPEKGRNRLGSMVEGRPDWVLSRQRAWGVPITLFVAKGTNQYLCDPAVNARIIAAVKAGGVDAWSEARAQEYLGSDYNADDYERVSDILDVWFDSGCTHVFTLESGRWPGMQWPADLYLEGSDQHRGWFQSSLLESCATRGRAPYNAVLTHGFTMDQKGMKMSKSLGNTIDPLKVMEVNGADIIRLWALSVDFTEDHRIGDEILKGVADGYRKLRNSFRYLLGALDGFAEAERVDVAEMPELERYVLALLAKLDGTLKAAVNDFDFNTYTRALTDFCNEDLSAFFFDIRKDSLYCDAADSPKRMAYRTVLDTLFHALVRYAAPVLVFTAEEVWGTRFPDGGSVHLLEWPVLPDTTTTRHSREGGNPSAAPSRADGEMDPRLRGDDELVEKWEGMRNIRKYINSRIELLRSAKVVRSSLECDVHITNDPESRFGSDKAEWAELLISAEVRLSFFDKPFSETRDLAHMLDYKVTRTTHHKCGRCWRHLPDVTEDGALCSRCDHVVGAMEAAQ